MSAARRLLFLSGLLLILALSTTAGALAQRRAPTAGSVSLVSPSACPAGGCAAGQRLTLRTDYDLDDATTQAQVCVYAPAAWGANLFTVDPWGSLTGAEYAPGLPGSPAVAQCGAAPPAGYALVGGALGIFPAGQFGDALGFSLRIGSTAAANGSVLVRVLESVDGISFTQTTQAFRSIPVVQANASSFAANEPSGCGSSAPCYVDSGGDAANGVSTGLKDALDAAPAGGTVTILGNYAIKANPVVLSQPVTLRGINDAALTTRGVGCANPMLRLEAGVTLSDLNISDGPCPAPGRDLIAVDNPTGDPVIIQSNDLTGGKDAVVVLRQTGLLTVQFNHIAGNSGYALQAAGGAAPLNLLANNLAGNRPGAQVVCTGLSPAMVDHNFWGAGVLPAVAAPTCPANPAARLGAPGLRRSGAPGIDAARAAIGTTRTTLLPGLAGQRTGGTADFDLYVVNHGSGSSENIPFFGVGVDAPSPCGSFYDLFAANGAQLPAALDLFFKFDGSSGCQATIASSYYCGQADAARYPLYWLDPALPGAGWHTTGSAPGGQATACLLPDNEIQVTIDSTGRPSFADLGFVPMVVGLPRSPTAIVFDRFAGVPGSAQILVQWTTTSELNTAGFYLTRLNELAGTYERISGLIPARGTAISGASYEYLDTGLTNGKTYYYRLEVVNTDQTTLWTGAILAIPNAPTPTPTITPTVSITPTASQTGTITVSATVTPTGSITPTPTITPTGSATITATVTPTGSITPTGSVTATRTISPTPTRTRTQITYTFSTSTRTPTRTQFVSFASRTPTRTPFGSSAPTATNSSGSGGYPVDTPPPGGIPTQDSGEGGYPAPTGEATRGVGTDEPTQTGGEGGYPVSTAEGTPSPGGTPPVPGLLPTNTRAAGTAPAATLTPTAPPTDADGRPSPQLLFWLSLGLGGLLGTGSLLAAGWYLFLRRTGQ